MDVFDELENIVFTYLVDHHMAAFKQSPYWTRHFQFLYMTEKKVVETDFALFRVLGTDLFFTMISSHTHIRTHTMLYVLYIFSLHCTLAVTKSSCNPLLYTLSPEPLTNPRTLLYSPSHTSFDTPFTHPNTLDYPNTPNNP